MDVDDIDITQDVFAPIDDGSQPNDEAARKGLDTWGSLLPVPPDSRNRNLFTTIVGSGVEEGAPAFDSDDDLYSARMNGMPGSTTSTTASKPRWMGANKAETVTLIKDLLDSDRPQLSQLIIDHLQSDDAHIMSLMDFLVRPIDQKLFEGAGSLGREATDVAAARCKAQAIESGSEDSPLRLEPYGVHVYDNDLARVDRSIAAASSIACNGFGPITAANPTDIAESDSEDEFTHKKEFIPPAIQDSTALAQGITAGQAASFAASFTDVQIAAQETLQRCESLLLAPEKRRKAERPASTSLLSPSKAVSAAAVVRPVSVMYPRVNEEVNAIQALVDDLQTAIAKSSDSSASALADADDALTNISSRLSSLTLGSNTGAGEGGDAVDVVIQLRGAIDAEVQCAKRSFKLMRMIVGGTYTSDALLEARGEDISRAVFSVFSTRSKGSFYHACLIIQKIVQKAPETFVKSIKNDSQRYVGAMLPYLHHPPVADALVQIVLLNHAASSQGGVGGIAQQAGAMNNPFGGFLKDHSTTYEGAVNLFTQRGTTYNNNLKTLLWKSLAGWGFLSVLASHIYRPEYACSPEHVTAAADAFLQIVKTLAAEDGFPVLAPLGYAASGIIRGLLAAACWPVAGVDYLFTEHKDAHAAAVEVQSTYLRDGITPVRQAEAMRVLNELVRLALQKTIPSASASPAQQTPLGGPSLPPPVPMVDNRLFILAPNIMELLLAGLPAIAHSLVRIHKFLHPDVVVVKNTKPVHAADSSGAPTAAAAGGASKKKKKRSKKKKSAGEKAGSAGNGTTPATPASDDEEDEDDAPEATEKSAAPSVPSPAPPKAEKPAAHASTAAAGAVSHHKHADNYKHPGHSYRAPFGAFRLAAVQLLAELIQCTMHAPKPAAQIPPTSTAAASAATSSAALTSPPSVASPVKEGAEPPATEDESETDEKHHAGGGGSKRKSKKNKKKGKAGKKASKTTDKGEVTHAGEKPEEVVVQAAALDVLSHAARLLTKKQSHLLLADIAAPSTEATPRAEEDVTPHAEADKEATLTSGAGTSSASHRQQHTACFDPAEFWGALVHWVVLYAHTNLYHIAFYTILKNILTTNAEPALQYLLHSSKMITLFIHHYEDMTPVPPPFYTDKDTIRTPKTRRPASSSARGMILNVLNALRLSIQSLPSTAFLPAHLRDHHSWNHFQPRLRGDTELLLTPLVAPPSRVQGGTDFSNFSTLSRMTNFLSQNSYLSFMGGKHKEASSSDKDESSSGSGDAAPDWDLGSAYAKQLGLGALTRHADALVVPLPPAPKRDPPPALPRNRSNSTNSNGSASSPGTRAVEEGDWSQTLANILAVGSSKVTAAAERAKEASTSVKKAFTNMDMLEVD